MKKVNVILILGLTLMLSSCETKKQKIDKAKEVVLAFMTNVSFDNYDVMFRYYPSFKNVDTYWIMKDFKIKNAILNKNIITVVGASGNSEVLFEVEKINGEYIINLSSILEKR